MRNQCSVVMKRRTRTRGVHVSAECTEGGMKEGTSGTLSHGAHKVRVQCLMTRLGLSGGTAIKVRKVAGVPPPDVDPGKGGRRFLARPDSNSTTTLRKYLSINIKKSGQKYYAFQSSSTSSNFGTSSSSPSSATEGPGRR